MGHVLRDAHHELRAISRSPIFSLTVVLILVLGIVANSAIFEIVS